MTIIAITIFTLAFCAISIGSISRPGPVQAINIQYEDPEPTEGQLDDPELAHAKEEPQQVDKLYTYYDVPLGDDLQEYAQDLCEVYEFPYYNVVVAMIGCESSYREGVVSTTNDYGYMQINTCNHQMLHKELGICDLLDGRQNIHGGIYILQQFYHKYDDIWLALMAYNCGETGASKLWAQGVYNTSYSRRIMQDADALAIRTS